MALRAADVHSPDVDGHVADQRDQVFVAVERSADPEQLLVLGIEDVVGGQFVGQVVRAFERGEDKFPELFAFGVDFNCDHVDCVLVNRVDGQKVPLDTETETESHDFLRVVFVDRVEVDR